MENYLFYAYLNFAKDNKQTFWPKLLSQPKAIIIIFSLVFVSCLSASVFALFNCLIGVIISITVELIFGGIFCWLSDKHHIDFCFEEYSKYKKYCNDLFLWMKSFDVNSIKDVKIVFDRITIKIDKMKAERESSNARLDKWLQILIIPVVIAIITAIVAKQISIEEMISYSISIIVLFAIIYGTILIFREISYLPQKHRIAQMECFANDLQAILDINKA